MEWRRKVVGGGGGILYNSRPVRIYTKFKLQEEEHGILEEIFKSG